MSAGGRSKTKVERKKKKDAKKAAMRAQYQAWAKDGVVKQSKRAVAGAKKRSINVNDHPLGRCGNVGCRRCSPSAVPRLGHRAWLAQRAERSEKLT